MEMSQNERTAQEFLEFMAANLDKLKSKMEAYCNSNGLDYDSDIFSDTYLKIYEKIAKDGLEDTTEGGMLNYFFMAFKTNLKREALYARNQKRNLNVTDDELFDMYENWYNDNNISEIDKLTSDLYKDFATIYICGKVAEQFDDEHYNLFRLKMLTNLTYKQLAQKTNCKGVRTKVLDVKNWCKQNITKDEIKQAFMENFENLIC